MKKFAIVMFVMFAFVCARNASAGAGGEAKKTADVILGQKEVDKLCDEQVKSCEEKYQFCDKKLQVCDKDLDIHKVWFQECDGELKQCKNYLKDCYPEINFKKGQSVRDAVDEARKVKPKPKKPKAKKPKAKKPKPEPLTDQRKCTSTHYLNGLYTYADEGWAWTEEYCGVKAAMNGHCLTIKQLYRVDQCLADKMEALEQKLAGMKAPEPLEQLEQIDTSDFVTTEQFGQVMHQIDLRLEQMEAANALRDQKLEGFAQELDDLKARVRSLESRVSKIEACLRKDPEFLDDDGNGEISYDEYKSRCGILAEIPEIKKTLAELKLKNLKQDAVLDDHELRITVLEEQRKAPYKMGPTAGAILVAMARGDVFLGGALRWDILTVKDKEGHDTVSFSAFLGVLDGVSGYATYPGIVYGGDILYYPGPQSIFAMGVGYTGLSTGITMTEREGQPDPDRQDHIVLGKLKLKHDVPISVRSLFTFGALVGLGAAYTDCARGHGWNFAAQVYLFLGFHFNLL